MIEVTSDLGGDGVVMATQVIEVSADAIIFATSSQDLTATGHVVILTTVDLSSTAVVLGTTEKDLATDGVVLGTVLTEVTATGLVLASLPQDLSATGIVVDVHTNDLSSDALLLAVTVAELIADGRVTTGLVTRTTSFDGSGYIKPPMQNSRSWTASAVIATQELRSQSLDATAIVRGPWIDLLADGFITSGTLSGTVVALGDGAWGGGIWYGAIAERIDGTTVEVPDATTPFVWTADTTTTVTHLALAVVTTATAGQLRVALDEMSTEWNEKASVVIPATSWPAAPAPAISWVLVPLPSAQTITAGTMYRVRVGGNGPSVLVTPTWVGSGLGAQVVNAVVVSTIPQPPAGQTVLIAGEVQAGTLSPREVVLDVTATTGRLIIGLGGTLRYATGQLLVQSRCQINWGGSLVMEAPSAQELALGATARVEVDGHWRMVGQSTTRYGVTASPSSGATLTLVDPPTGWQVGDQIYVASSSGTEGVFRTLTAVSGTTITLDAAVAATPAQSLVINTQRSAAVRSSGQATIIWGQTGSCWWQHAELRRCAGAATVAFSGASPSTLTDVVFVEGREAGSLVGSEAIVLPSDTSKITLSDLTIVRYVRGIVTSTAKVTIGGTTLCAAFLQDGTAIQSTSAQCVVSVIAQEIAGGVIGLGGGLDAQLVIPHGDLRFGHSRAALVTVFERAGSVQIQGGSVGLRSGEIGGVVALGEGAFLGEMILSEITASVPAVVADRGAYGLVNGRIRGSSLTADAPVRITDGRVVIDLVDEDAVYPARVSTFSGTALGTFAPGSRIADRDGTWTPRGEHRRSTTYVHSGTASLEVAAFAGQRYELVIMVIPGSASQPVSVSWWLLGTGEATFRLGSTTQSITMTGVWSHQNLIFTPSSDGAVLFAVELTAGSTDLRCWIDEVIIS